MRKDMPYLFTTILYVNLDARMHTYTAPLNVISPPKLAAGGRLVAVKRVRGSEIDWSV